jgi:putative membrane-bound dehydrogenase-like protein
MIRTLSRLALAAMLLVIVPLAGPIPAQKQQEKPPHGQDKMPGPALTPAEAVKKMTVPPGFSVEIVAAEPDLINPTAMTFDEQGRIWVCESIEYPRREPGVGKDRIKVLEDTKGTGKIDKVTVFAEGLNIPSGIAVGHGGVWVANSPDILFYRIGPDLKAAGKPEVVVTGFGRFDTHELPNSLTWGPDGWLYGLNGVFNACKVKQGNKEWDFTCALFRIHPKTREFQLWAEGTSNPWGIAYDPEGSAFLSACVIDHLWHLVETGYYHRQGGPYPPFTWKLGSIVQHRHQKAAYCGIHYFDSDAYPEEYRDKLYMGNIHGGCINSDELTRDGSTYFGKPRPDFLTANDAWFMPVVQKTGPDGCLYILDWYDRYHCYQDANRDPAGIDRLNGRLYRVRYHETPRAPKFDLSKETDDQLIDRLGSPNVFFRDLAQRLLTERATPEVTGKLERVILDPKTPRKQRLHALFARVSSAPIRGDFQAKLLADADPTFRAWVIRAAGNEATLPSGMATVLAGLASRETSPDVLLQVAIATRKAEPAVAFPVWLDILARCGDDKVIPHIVWQNLHPLLVKDGDRFLALAAKVDLGRAPGLAQVLPRAVDRILGNPSGDPAAVVKFIDKLATEGKSEQTLSLCLTALTVRIQNGEIAGKNLDTLRTALVPVLAKFAPESPVAFEVAVLSAAFKEPKALEKMRATFASNAPESRRLQALDAVVAANDSAVLPAVAGVLAGPGSADFRGKVLGALPRLDSPETAKVILEVYPKLDGDLPGRAIDVLATRAVWGKELVAAVEAKKVPVGVVNANQIRKLLALKDDGLSKRVTTLWGRLREDRNPEREKVVRDMEDVLRRTKGDPMRGIAVFTKQCSQCHKIHGEGQEVGPDLTGNGRSTFAQLLSNVFDPSLVIGAGYQAVTVTTTRGQVITGLLVEESPQRVVLKLQGGKVETIARGDIDEYNLSKLSLMPEGLEKQLSPQEAADLFAFLCLDKHPKDPNARKIPGAP